MTNLERNLMILVDRDYDFLLLSIMKTMYILKANCFDRHNREIDTCTLSRTSAVIIIT